MKTLVKLSVLFILISLSGCKYKNEALELQKQNQDLTIQLAASDSLSGVFHSTLKDIEAVFDSIIPADDAPGTTPAEGELTIEGLRNTDSEGALEMIENIAAASTHYHLAANLPNMGQIGNLPLDAIVETPVVVDGSGVHPVHMGNFPAPVAELLRREITVAQLCVDSAVEGNRKKALQCLLLDPVISDIEIAKKILDDYLTEYREYLPQYWK